MLEWDLRVFIEVLKTIKTEDHDRVLRSKRRSMRLSDHLVHEKLNQTMEARHNLIVCHTLLYLNEEEI